MRSRELERAVAVAPSARAACATTEAGGKGLSVWTEPTPQGCPGTKLTIPRDSTWWLLLTGVRVMHTHVSTAANA